MNNQPLVSVVMPCFNGQAFLEQAIESILSQSLQNIELIIVDDHSTDNSPIIMNKFRDYRLRVVRHTTNMGMSRALNDGIQAARAVFIAQMDADDISDARRLEEQIKIMDCDEDIAVVGTGVKVIDQEGNFICYHNNPTEDKDIRKAFAYTLPIWPCSQMWRKTKLEQSGLFDERIRVAQDVEFTLRLCSVGKARNLSLPLYIYRRYSSGLSSVPVGSNISRSAVSRKVFALKRMHDQESLDKLYKFAEADFQGMQVHRRNQEPIEKMYQYYFGLGMESMFYGNRDGGRTYFRKASELHPTLLTRSLLSYLAMLPSFIISLVFKANHLVKKYIYIYYAGNVVKLLEQKTSEETLDD